MAKSKSLFALARHGTRKSSNNKNDTLASAHTETGASDVCKKPAEELLRFLSNLPEESDSERELSFSFLINNESSKMHDENNDTKNEDSSKIEELQKATTQTKQKTRKRRNSRSSCGGSTDGVLLNLFVPTSVKRSQSMRRDNHKPNCFTLAELENRDRNLARGFGCWSALLVGRQHRAIHANVV